MTGLRAMFLAVLVPVAALAGCAGDDPQDTGTTEPIKPGSTGSGSPVTTQPSPVTEFKPRGTSERWHFHDYWKGDPTITLMETDVVLEGRVGDDGVPQFGALLELPHGTIVPPETGFLTFNVTWPPDAPGTINLTYKPADANDFFHAGEIANAVALTLNTTESNCDVPHRQTSSWKFNFTAQPTVPPTGAPPREFHLVIQATIGRPLFIDPPHLNWWRDGDVIPLVQAGAGEIRTARTPASNLTIPGGVPSGPPASTPTARSMQDTVRVPVDAGRIVPEGTTSIVAMLNWTATLPDSALTLRWNESNLPSEGVMDLITEAPGARVYSIAVRAPQTDTTYSNRTTWEFRIVPEGDPAAAFDGSFTLVAWATQLDPAAAVAAVSKAAGS